MKLRTQNILAILPILLGTLGVMGVGEFYSELKQIFIGTNHEITAYAVSIAEFLTPNDIARLLENNEFSSQPTRRITESISRVFSSGNLRHIAIYANDGSQKLYSLGPLPLQAPKPFIQKNQNRLNELVRHERPRSDSDEFAIISDTISGTRADEPDCMAGIAPVTDGLGHLIAVVFVEKDISITFAKVHKNLFDLLAWTLAISLLGLATTSLLTFVLNRPIQRLTSSLESAATQRNRKLTDITSTPLREIDDLGNTFNTMTSVLNEAEKRISQTLVQAEQFRSRADLEHAFSNEFRQPVSLEIGSYSIRSCMVGDSPDTFCLMLPTSSGFFIVLCRFQKQREDELNRIVTTSALASFTQHAGPRDDPKNLYDFVAELHTIDYFQVVSFDTEHHTATIWIKHQEEPEMLLDLPLEYSSSWVFHTFPVEVSSRIYIYTQLFSQLSIERLLDELVNVVAGDSHGALVLVKHRNQESADSPPH